MGSDYGGVSVNLMFSHGDTRQCHRVDILQDDDCEMPAENFFADLAYISGILPITIDPVTTQVTIDDSSEPECGKYALSIF